VEQDGAGLIISGGTKESSSAVHVTEQKGFISAYNSHRGLHVNFRISGKKCASTTTRRTGFTHSGIGVLAGARQTASSKRPASPFNTERFREQAIDTAI